MASGRSITPFFRCASKGCQRFLLGQNPRWNQRCFPRTADLFGRPLSHSADTVRTLSPAVKLLVQKHGLEAQSIPATGPKGHLLKGDVLQFLASGQAVLSSPSSLTSVFCVPAAPRFKQTLLQAKLKSSAPAAPRQASVRAATYDDVPNSGMRSTIARRLSESKSTVPHSYAVVEATIDRVIAARKALKSQGHSVSVNDFIVAAVAAALVRVPEVNVRWHGNEAMHLNAVDVGVAVATDGGLIVPLIRNAHQLRVTEISAAVKDLAKRARDRTLKPEEFQGGSFSISNLGMFGITSFTAIINPPQAAILAVGRSARKLVEDSTVQHVLLATLCFDSRAVSQEAAVKWLQIFQHALSAPELYL